MNRSQKEQVVENLRSQFDKSQFVAFVDYRGITVDKVDKVRRTCEAKELKYLVAKNTLIRKAVEGTEKSLLMEAEFLKGMTGVFFSGDVKSISGVGHAARGLRFPHIGQISNFISINKVQRAH